LLALHVTPANEQDRAQAKHLARDYERLAQTLAGLHYLIFACLMLHRLIPFVNVSP